MIKKEIIMGRTGISYLDVSNAIATIQGHQKNPTVDSIREELGTGSRSTIAKYFTEWKSKNGVKNTTESGIPTELQNLIQGLWEKVQSDADQKIQTHQEEANAEILDAKNQLAQIQQQNALLHIDIQTLNQKLNIQAEINESLKNTINADHNEKTKLLERITSLVTKNADHKTENDRLHQLLKNTQDNLVHYQQAIEKQRFDQQLQLEKERIEFESKLTLLQHQLNETTQEKTKALQSLDHLTQDHQKQTERLETTEKSYIEMQTQNQCLLIENRQLNENTLNKDKLLSSLSEELKEKMQEHTDLHIQIGILKNECATLNKNNNDINTKIENLESNYQKITQENITLKMKLEIRESV